MDQRREPPLEVGRELQDVQALDAGTQDGVAALRAGIDFLQERVRRPS